MNQLSFNLLTIFLIVACFQGVVLALTLVSTKRFRIKSNIALSVALITTSMLILHNVSFLIGLQEYYPSLAVIPWEQTMLLSCSLYFFVHYLVFPNAKFGKSELLFLIPALLQFLVFFVWYLIAIFNTDILNKYFDLYLKFELVDESLAIIFCAIVLFAIYKKVVKYQKNLFNNYATIDRKDLSWLKGVIISFFILWIIWTLSHIKRTIDGEQVTMYIVWIGMAAIMYWMGYFMFLRREYFEIPSFSNVANNNTSNLSEKTEEYFAKLLLLVEEEKLYTDPELNMTSLAEHTGLSNGYLSQIINQKTGKNFFDFINHYRVDAVKQNLKNPDFDHYSILAIGLEAGFKSKSTFNAVFKRITGKTPTQYKKSL